MDKDYIEVKIPILDSVDEMKVVKTFTQEQLWFVCAIAKAFEKSEQQVKKQKEVINKIEEKIKENIKNAKYEITTLTITDKLYYKYIDDMLNELLQILEDKEVK